ncbi:hypothetical protein PVL30_004951 [Lodderomyces elongisporus]|uniref:Enoyl reductase (ER) domain-containing protein n=1 Tax=Lodderomyces elongisporus (strain ATCC 11503 / CBS 2605 / JCM 1781 / NBRC 1676 / NRRL YB-4239) TaxID=379508 RepID=A5E3E9_LODEL|nr:uncharacterized protein PVL30_004951 [Lodderomyces elongisporus]EDK45957.1 conserved hypothetical protein [Lodderomyces elongisporus NRRL YB-4239]WLF81154.1 hypothetical protein PVL30_004951 [Lodderomyces elongisporus]
MSQLPETMKAVVYHGPYDVRLEDHATPKIEASTDVILKVHYSGLCGTDLHAYRGHIKGPVNMIIGHEFVGEIVSKGDNISQFDIGDLVVSAFTIQCGQCWHCKHGFSGNCSKTNTFGKIGLDGGQAEYVRVPYAENTIIKLPSEAVSNPADAALYVLMADIFITGYYGVKKIMDFLTIPTAKGIKSQSFEDCSILQIGAGPVGLCALRVLKHFGFKHIVVVDSIPSRLAEAKRLGASKVINFEEDEDALEDYIHDELEQLGFDAVLEVVGAKAALQTAADSVRANGFISSLGMGHEELPFNALDCYLINMNISFGRCPAWSLFPEALEIFNTMKESFSNFVEYKAKLSDVKEAFELFDKHKVGKVVFDLTNGP